LCLLLTYHKNKTKILNCFPFSESTSSETSSFEVLEHGFRPIQPPEQLNKMPHKCLSEKLNEALQKSKQIPQKSDDLSQKLNNALQKSNGNPQKSDELSKKLNKALQKSNEMSQKLNRTSPIIGGASQPSDNFTSRFWNLWSSNTPKPAPQTLSRS
jgi:hypothetical protein